MTIGSLGAFALSMVNSFKRVISPALVLAFAALEGVALGAISKFFDAARTSRRHRHRRGARHLRRLRGHARGVQVPQHQGRRQVPHVVIAAVFGMVGTEPDGAGARACSAADLGLFGFGGLGILFAVAGLVLGIFMLILDFDFVEQGIANRIPEAESWRAAFAMTVSLVWIYTNLLRLLAIFSSD